MQENQTSPLLVLRNCGARPRCALASLGASNRNFAVQGSARPSPKLPFPALKMCGVPHIFEGKANFAKTRCYIQSSAISIICKEAGKFIYLLHRSNHMTDYKLLFSKFEKS